MRNRGWMFGMYLSILIGSLGFGQTSNQGPQRDPQALAILVNAVNAAGGLPALTGVSDYTASGHITLYWDQVLDGNVTLTGRAFDYRIDASLPDGTLSWFILKNQGMKKDIDGTVTSLLYQQVTSLETLTFPLIQIAKAVSDASVNVSYSGIFTRAGQQVYGVHIRTLALPYFVNDMRSKLVDKDFYFDVNSFQVLAVEDFAFPTTGIANGIRRQVLFSNYQQVQGVSVPFAIIDAVGNQTLTFVTISQISFNAGYTDSQFQP